MFKKILHRPLWLLLSGVLLVAGVSALLLLHFGASGSAYGQGPRLLAGPNSAGPGSTIAVTGFEFPASTNVQVYFQSRGNGVVSAVTNGSGFFNVSLTLPKTYTQGTAYVYAASNTYSAKTPFTLARPYLGTAPDSSSVPALSDAQESAAISGNGFVAHEAVNLVLNDGPLGTSHVGTVTADGQGHFTYQLTLPDLPTDILATLTATGAVGQLSASSAVHRHAVIHTSPTFGPAGTQVHVKGRGFGSNKIVTVFFQDKPVEKARTNSVGDFSATFIVPRSATLKPSFNAVQATDGEARAAISFQVIPSVTIHPSSGEPGQTINLTGSQFTPDGTIHIYLQDPSNPSSVGIPLCEDRERASDRGTFDTDTDCVIPHDLKRGKVYAIIIVDVATGISVDINYLVR